jgi:PTS system galactitol-specific IIA component
MGMIGENMFKENLVVMNSSAATREEAIGELADLLIAGKYAAESFKNAVIEREKIFPTGLPSEPIGVAIPHTDVEHVIRPAIAVSVLAKPVQFKLMGNNERDVNVRVIFMLAIKEPHMQVELLQQLMNCIQDSKRLLSIIDAKDKSSLVNLCTSGI